MLDTTNGRDSTPKNLDKLEDWTNKKLMRLNKMQSLKKKPMQTTKWLAAKRTLKFMADVRWDVHLMANKASCIPLGPL